MEWFHLHSDSIGALAALVLCLVVTFYLLSIQGKSKEGWYITGLFIIYTFLHATGFFADSTTSSISNGLLQLQSFIIGSLVVYFLWFIYSYKASPFKRECQ